ncbi:ATP-binding protein [Alphaproteobacteria bacterium]|nr:ATP-binding protein [Alphaproteobacteria bacterium]
MFQIKQFLPRSLLGRSFLIIVMPLILLQIVSTWIFYDRHWGTITRRLTTAVAGEIASVIEYRRSFAGDGSEATIFQAADAKLDLRIKFKSSEILPNEPYTTGSGIMDEMLGNALRERVQRPFHMDTRSHPHVIRIQIQLPDGILDVIVDRERLFSSTTYIFVIWMVGTSLVLFAVAMLFMRNQVRPIRRLANAVDNFGKGRDAPDFKPEGAIEIRQAAAAFNMMRDRIQRMINQRTEMLAGVSHDLRTPLTRMKLQVAMLEDSADIKDLKADLSEMEKMVEEYLSFARGEGTESVIVSNVNKILVDIVNRMGDKDTNIKLQTSGDLTVPLRPNAFRRCVTNLINNATIYGGGAAIQANRVSGAIEIIVDDSGPGIPEDQREKVFRPFYRLDNARGPDKAGTGLGLTIARDVMRGLGGDLVLEESPTGGARAKMRLPI